MWGTALKILKENWVLIALFSGGMWLGITATHHELSEQALAFANEKQELTDDFNAQKKQWDKERITAASKYATDLQSALNNQQAWQDKADVLSRELADKERQHTRTVNDLKRRLSDALKSDGTTYTGIGPASLQLWRESLGYPGTESFTAGDSLSETASGVAGNTGNASGTRGGLSPAGILSHSGEYGKWCLTLRDRLQAISDFYNSKEHTSK